MLERHSKAICTAQTVCVNVIRHERKSATREQTNSNYPRERSRSCSRRSHTRVTETTRVLSAAATSRPVYAPMHALATREHSKVVVSTDGWLRTNRHLRSSDTFRTRPNVNSQVPTLILFSTCVTPGAAHAAISASSRSAQERTVPLRMTLPPSASTKMRFASS
jgi:hypothetical protein